MYFISLHTTMLGGLKIRIVSIDPTNGRKTDQYSLNSEGDISSVADILSVGANSASPIIAWTDKSRSALKVNVIGSKNVASFDVGSGVEKIVLHAPYHIEARPHFLVHYETAKQHWAEVYHVDLKSSNVKKAYSLPKLAGQGAFSTSVSDANVYFTRVSEAEISVVASTSHGKLARRPTKGFAASPVHSVTEVSVKGDVVSAVRSAVYTSSGKWVLVRDGTLSWQRPEYLAGVTSAVWAYPQIEEALLQELEVESHRNVIAAYVHRVTRHLQDLEKLPGYLSSLPSKLTHSLGAGKTVETTAVVHDTFGYHKTVVCATETGRLVALDAGNSGQVIWNVQAVTLQPGQHWNSPQLVSKPDGTVLALNPSDNTWIGFNATSGAKFAATPNTAETETGFSYAFADGALVGSSAKQASAAPLWTFKPIGDEHILSVTSRPADDPVASIGKVLGDRRVLYKYLNPNLILVTSISETLKTATFHVLDAVTGSILASSSHTDVDTSLPISSTLSENWFAYSFATSSTTTTKGHQLVIGELYESALPNDRGVFGTQHNYSAVQQPQTPHVVMQTYNIPEPISHMAVTQTRQGITSRQLLAVLAESGSVVGIPRQVIDPRRPVGRDATTQEQMEGLMRYAPTIDFDPKWYLNHARELLGIERVTTSPAVLESTSLVFAYGLDVFGTRVAPSFAFDVLGKDFNKGQMLATVLALAVGTGIVAPLVSSRSFCSVMSWMFVEQVHYTDSI